MYRLLKITSLWLLAATPLAAQVASPCPTGKEGNIWYFGAYGFAPAGLDFNTGSPPAYLGDCGMPNNSGYEAYAVANDGNGQLLFYSNGDKVWNRNHQVMAGVGFGIGGHASATQILTLPQPGNPGIHYIFTPEALEQLTVDSVQNIYYSTVDMALDGGLGGIVQQKVLLHEKSTEKVTAARHCNGEDWWVLTHELGSNRFFAWLLDANGIAAQPVVSMVGLGNGGIKAQKGGAIKVSPDGQRLAMAESTRGAFLPPPHEGHIELFQFDNATGAVSDPVLLRDSLRFAYGVEFSPDNSKVYFQTWGSFPSLNILQFDLGAGDANAIAASGVVVADETTLIDPKAMTLGPDGMIYVVVTSYFGNPQEGLDVIANPNDKGTACQYLAGAQGFVLPDSVGIGLGLPNFPASYYAPHKPYLSGPAEACSGDTLRFHVTANCAAVAWDWEVPGGSVAQQQGDSVWVSFNQPGPASVIVHRTTACTTWSDTLRVNINGGMMQLDSVFLCAGDSTLIFGQWVNQAGEYSQAYPSVLGCDSIVSAVVTVFPAVDTTFLMLISCDSSALGTTFQLLSTPNGCDSIMATIVSFSPTDSTFLSFTTCDPSAAGIFTNVYTNQFGCDSIVTETVSLLLGDTVFLSSSSCDPLAAGVFTNIYTNQSGCDSIVTETVSLLPGDTIFLASSSCDPMAAGVFTNFYTNQSGCDSIVTETVSLLLSDTTYAATSTCNPEQVGTQFTVLFNQYGCDSIVILETIYEEPFTVSLGGNITIAQGDTVILAVEVDIPFHSISSIFWSPANPCADCPTFAIHPDVTTNYSVTVTSVDGCSAEDQVIVEVIRKEDQVFVPSAFSPNGDGINDKLLVYGSEATEVQFFRIFDRWGEMVFEAKDFPVNDELFGWDGSFRGKVMDNAVFVWLAEIRFPNNIAQTIIGYTTLVQ